MTTKTAPVPVGHKFSYESIRHIVENPHETDKWNPVQVACAALHSRKHDIVDKSIWIGSYARSRRPMAVVVSDRNGYPKTSKDIIRKGVTHDRSHVIGYAQVKVETGDYISVAAHTPESVVVVLLYIDTITMPVDDKATLMCKAVRTDIFNHNGGHTVIRLEGEDVPSMESSVANKLINKARKNSLYPTDWWDHHLTHLSVTPRSFTGLVDYSTVRPTRRDDLSPIEFLKALETTAMGFHKRLWKELKDKEDKRAVRLLSHRTLMRISHKLNEVEEGSEPTVTITVDIPYSEQLRTVVTSENFFDLSDEPLLILDSHLFSEFVGRVKTAKDGRASYRTLRI